MSTDGLHLRLLGELAATHAGRPVDLGGRRQKAEVARLSELREVGREALLDARLRAGESSVLVPDLEALIAAQPLREERWRLLVVALYNAGRQADALAALRRARATLAEQLGVD